MNDKAGVRTWFTVMFLVIAVGITVYYIGLRSSVRSKHTPHYSWTYAHADNVKNTGISLMGLGLLMAAYSYYRKSLVKPAANQSLKASGQ